MSVGRRIRHCRQARGWTLRDLSERVNGSISYLSEIERGIADPTISTLRQIAVALDVSLNALLVREPHCISVTEPTLPVALEQLARECRVLGITTPLQITVNRGWDFDVHAGEMVAVGWTLTLRGEAADE